MKKQHLFLLGSILILSLLSACSNENTSTSQEKPDPILHQAMMSKGFQLLESNCFSCHTPKGNFESRVGPPMIAVKKHYIDEHTTLETFTESLIAFVQQPSEEQSKMPGALKRFGLMPKMDFTTEQLSAIAAYIYHTDIESPDWFDEHYEEERKKHQTEQDSISPLEKGLQLAMATKAVLGKNLLGAINSKGTEHALAFCNQRAYPLTDSMAVELDAPIKRVSDKARNPKNQANDSELAYIQQAHELIEKGEKVKPMLAQENGKTLGYYPIMTNKMCMQCHGQEEQIKPATLAKIKRLYPEDKAVNYSVNKLRGIWVIELDEDK